MILLQYNGYKDIDMFYDRVRSLLEVDKEDLSNATIDFPENAPLAESMIKRKVKNWEELPEEKQDTFETAIVFQTAIVVMPIHRGDRFKVAQAQALKIEYKDNDLMISDILSQYLEELLTELVQQEDVDLPPIFEIS